MGIKVTIAQLGRSKWVKAKFDIMLKYPNLEKSSKKEFYDKFGKENGMKIVLTKDSEFGFPIIESIEFKDKKSYMWFLLRWA